MWDTGGPQAVINSIILYVHVLYQMLQGKSVFFLRIKTDLYEKICQKKKYLRQCLKSTSLFF